MTRAIETSIDIDAAPGRVWAILADLPAYAGWNPFVTRAEGELAAGAELQVTIQPVGGRAMTFRPTVLAAEPGRELRWLGHLLVRGLFDGEHVFRLEPLPGGGTRLHHGERFAGVLAGPLLRLVERGSREGFEAMNRALKARAEAGATGR